MKTLDQIRPSITSLDAIPAIPAIVQPLASMLQLPVEQVNVEQIVQLVSYDSSIAAQCLRMANSPLFGRRKTETVRSANPDARLEARAGHTAGVLSEPDCARR